MAGALRNLRDQAPSSYLLTIKPFSELLKANSEVYETAVFETGGYKWRLVFYQRGNSKDGGSGHISMYVRLEHTDSLPLNWVVNVDLKLFIKNQTQNKFLTVQDGDVKRLNEAKKEWGFAKMLPISTFDDSRNGYLVNDSCVVGTEIFVVKPSDKQENLTFIRNPTDGKFTWRISNFSKLDQEVYETDVYTVGEMKWKISIHPKGYGHGTGNSLSMLLWGVGSSEDQDKAKTWVRVHLRLLDQINSRHYQREYWGYYPPDKHVGRGDAEFIKLKDLNDPSRGFLVNDRLIAEADMEVISVTKVVPS